MVAAVALASIVFGGLVAVFAGSDDKRATDDKTLAGEPRMKDKVVLDRDAPAASRQEASGATASARAQEPVATESSASIPSASPTVAPAKRSRRKVDPADDGIGIGRSPSAVTAVPTAASSTPPTPARPRDPGDERARRAAEELGL